MWKDHQQRNGLKDEEPADNLLTSIELVLDNHNQLVEMNRLPGENEVEWSLFLSAERGNGLTYPTGCMLGGGVA